MQRGQENKGAFWRKLKNTTSSTPEIPAIAIVVSVARRKISVTQAEGRKMGSALLQSHLFLLPEECLFLFLLSETMNM
jgi:hypothetical protein